MGGTLASALMMPTAEPKSPPPAVNAAVRVSTVKAESSMAAYSGDLLILASCMAGGGVWSVAERAGTGVGEAS